MSRFLTDFSEKELKDCIAAAYDEKFDTKAIAPLQKSRGRPITWSCSMERPSPLRIWLFPFFPT